MSSSIGSSTFSLNLHGRAGPVGGSASATDATVHSVAAVPIHLEHPVVGATIPLPQADRLYNLREASTEPSHSIKGSAPAPEGTAPSLVYKADRTNDVGLGLLVEKVDGQPREFSAEAADQMAEFKMEGSADTAKKELRFWTETAPGNPYESDQFKENDKISRGYTQLRDTIAPGSTEFSIDFMTNTVSYYVKEQGNEVLKIEDLDIAFQTHPTLRAVYEELKEEALRSAKIDTFSCLITRAGVYSFLNAPQEVKDLSRAPSALGKIPFDRNHLENEIKKLSFFQKIPNHEQAAKLILIHRAIETLDTVYTRLIADIDARLGEIHKKKKEDTSKKDAVEMHRLSEQEKEMENFQKEVKTIDVFAIGAALAASALAGDSVDERLAESVFQSVVAYGNDPAIARPRKIMNRIKGIVTAKTPEEETEAYALKVVGLLSNLGPSCPRAYYFKICQEKGIAAKAPILEGALIKDLSERIKCLSERGRVTSEPSLDRWLSFFLRPLLTGENRTKLEEKVKRLFD